MGKDARYLCALGMAPELAKKIADISNTTNLNGNDIQNSILWNDLHTSVRSYGATGSNEQTTGNISAGSNILTVDAVTDFVVGDYISVAGAYSDSYGNSFLVSKITRINGSIFTLADTATVSVTGATVQHDSTHAINSAIADIVNGGGGSVYFPKGHYVCNGPISPATGYSVLYTPNVGTQDAPVTLTLRGQCNGSSAYGEMQTGSVANAGVIIRTDQTTKQNLWSLFNGTSGGVAWSYVTINMSDITWRQNAGTSGPSMVGLMLSSVANVNLFNVTVDTDTDSAYLPNPTNPSAIGILFPAGSNYAQVTAFDAYVCGYNVGVAHSEHAIFTGVFIQQCANAIKLNNAAHNSVYNRVLVQECPNIFLANGTAYLTGVMDIEALMSGNYWWVQSSLSTGDAGPAVYGKICYTFTESGIGNRADITSLPNTMTNLLWEDVSGGSEHFASVPVSASPFTHTFTQGGEVFISGGTITNVSLARRGVTLDLGTSRQISVKGGDTVTVAYSSEPSVYLGQ